MSIDIAVIGISGRFPGARNTDEFWQNLCDGVESVRISSDAELLASGFHLEQIQDPSFVRAAGTLDDIERFDAEFFGINPREAQLMDPQQRVFLEVCWSALESAGYTPDKYMGSIGVYAGVGGPVYLFRNILPNRHAIQSMGEDQIWMNNAPDHLSTRVSYKLNLSGPSMTVQTACSSSLVALHLACQELLVGACDLALSGGVSIGVFGKGGYFYQEGYKLSRDGHCRSFDSEASGTVPGSGAAVLVLKRLDDALRDRDSILAVVKGSAVNNDGGQKLGYTTPSVDGQSRVILEALAAAGVSADTVSYVETHGTGTELGDPAEIAALSGAFRRHTEAVGYCAIGSVKTNIGHADAAAGAIGAIKTVLALQHRLLPASLHFNRPNPKIAFDTSPFVVNTALKSWSFGKLPLRAGVSSFGIGGTNAHLVMEEAPELPESPEPQRPVQVLPLSARTQSALDSMRERLAQYCATHSNRSIEDIAATLQFGRKEFNHRLAIVSANLGDALKRLKDERPPGVPTGKRRSIAFLFPGGGAQHLRMASEIYKNLRPFRDTFDECAEIVRSRGGIDLGDVVYPRGDGRGLLDRPSTALPALFSIEVALANTWKALGVLPAAMIGHSVGEYAAAYIAGVFRLEDALRAVLYRGELLERLPPGAMLSVAAPASEIQPLLGPDVGLAAVNAARLCVVSGKAKAIEDLRAFLTAQKIECDRLHITTAAHSPMVDAVVEPFRQEIARMTLRPPRVPFISSLTGVWITESEAVNDRYWALQLRQPVLFAEGLNSLVSHGDWILLELGPGQVLTTLARQLPMQFARRYVLPSLPHPTSNESDYEFFVNQLARFWEFGGDLNWEPLQDGRYRRIPLPTYPFEGARHWIQTPTGQIPAELQRSSAPEDWTYLPSWMQSSEPFAQEIQDASSYLVFTDDLGLGDRLAARLTGEGKSVAVVRAGDKYVRLSEREWCAVPGCLEDYQQVLADSAAPGRRVILYLWNWGPSELQTDSDRLFAPFRSLSRLAQALGAERIATDLFVLSDGIHDVGRKGLSYPAKSLVLGPCWTITKEFPNIRCRSIDFEPAAGDEAYEFVVNRVRREMASAFQETVAYADGKRWLPTFERVQISQTRDSRLRHEGVYLITGGLGGIGLEIAEHLCRVFRAKCVLVGRSADPNDARLSRLRAQQAEFMVLSADVTSLRSMQSAVVEARRRFGHIHGVIHAAGVPGGGLLAFHPLGDFPVLKPKVLGSLILHQLFKEDPPDFTLLCSSLAVVTAPIGQAEYVSANAFLDALASHAGESGAPHTLALDWDLWRAVGMATITGLPAELQEMHDRNAAFAMLPSEALRLFEWALATPFPRVVVSTRDLPGLQESARKARIEMLDPALASGKDSAAPKVSGTFDEPEGPRSALEQQIARIWQEILGVEDLSVNDSFFDVGGHSLLATRLIVRLRDSLLVQIPFRSFFEMPTIGGLAKLVERARCEGNERALERILNEVEPLTQDQVQTLLNNVNE